MSTNPSEITPQDDFAAHGIQVEAPPAQEAPPQVAPVRADESNTLVLQALRETAQQNAILANQLANQSRPQPEQQTPDRVRVKFDEDNKPVIDPKDLMGVMKPMVDEYHNAVVAQMAPAFQQVKRDQQMQDAVEFLKTQAPELITEGREKEAANAVWGFYNSPLNPGTDDASKSAYAVQQLKQMSLPSGNPTLRQVQSANQIGRTSGDATTSHPFPVGSKVTLTRKSISDVGLDNFRAATAREAYLRDYNDQHNMGWKFEELRDD